MKNIYVVYLLGHFTYEYINYKRWNTKNIHTQADQEGNVFQDVIANRELLKVFKYLHYQVFLSFD